MVSALMRNSEPLNSVLSTSKDFNAFDSVMAICQRRNEITAFPSALKEFINSTDDLPTIEELARQSKSLAQILGWAC